DQLLRGWRWRHAGATGRLDRLGTSRVGGGHFGLSGRFGLSRRGGGTGASPGDGSQQGADIHSLTRLGRNGLQNTGRRGRHLDGDLVGLEFDNGLIGGYGVPDLLEPLA